MKKNLLFLAFTIFSLNCYSQIIFEKGYFIKNDNQKVECLIKNNDWAYNPTDFKYKLSENDDIKTCTVEDVKEFAVNDASKFKRRKVKIDRSSEILTNMSTDKNPIFNEEVLFLKTLVEGKASLFLYEIGDLVRFFYDSDSTEIEQLVFKSYKISPSQIASNNYYKLQLWNNLKCPNITLKKIESLQYRKNELINFFQSYNNCNNSEVTYLFKKPKKDLFNLNIRPGLNYSSLSIKNLANNKTIDFGDQFGFRFGIETEFIMPYNKNKWAIIIEPTYQYFNSEMENPTVDLKLIQLPFGIRHYFIYNENSKLFVNCSFNFNFSGKNVIDLGRGTKLDINTRNNMAFGFGYKLNNKYSLELNYQTSREILGGYVTWNSSFKTLSLIFGYSIF